MKLGKITGSTVLVILLTVIAVVPGTTAHPPHPALQAVAVDSRANENLSYLVAKTDDSYTAFNPTHHLAIEFTEKSIEVGFQDETWQLHTQHKPLAMTALTNQLTYQYDAYDAWYINGPNGLQQGFTLYEPVDIQFNVGGTLRTVLDGERLLLVDHKGTTVLTYSGLTAWDAHHVDVPVVMTLEDRRLAFTVNDAYATYPITIDPWLEAQFEPADNASLDQFGWAVALDGNTALIGAPNDDDMGGQSGSSYVFTFNGVNWSQQAKLLASDGAPSDWFGYSLAIDGDTALIGSYSADGVVANSGAAYVFVRSGVTWSQQAKLFASDGVSGDNFGNSVALHGDTAIVGADEGSGRVYVFSRSGTMWSQQQKLDAPQGGRFGDNLDLQGNMLLIGAPWSKSAYLYMYNGAAWVQQAWLTPNDPRSLDIFGHSVELGDQTILIGAERFWARGYSEFFVYIFEWQGSGWVQVAKVPNPAAIGSLDAFGYELEVEGNIALIAAQGPISQINSGNGGRVYVFKRSLMGDWSQVDVLQASDTAPYNGFGSGLAYDGNRMLVGAFAAGSDSGGAAYVLDAQFTIPAAAAACNGPNLEINVTDSGGPFDITASGGVNLPLLGVGTGTHTVNGPEKWDNITVTRTGDYLASVNLGQSKCRSDERPLPFNPPNLAHLTNLFPVFAWTPITDANNYRVFLFDDTVVANRTVDIRENSGGATQMTLSQALVPGRYFWRVRGRQNRLWSLWSVRRTLFIDASNSINIPAPLLPQPIAPPNERLPEIAPITPTPIEPTSTPPPPPNSR